MDSNVPDVAFKPINKVITNETTCKHLKENGFVYVGDLMCSSFSEIGGVHGIGLNRLVKLQHQLKEVGATLETPIINWSNLRPKDNL